MKIEHAAKRSATRSPAYISVPAKRSVARLVLEGRPLSADTLEKNLEVEMDEHHSSPEWRQTRGPPQGRWALIGRYPNMSTPENASPTASRRERAALDQMAEQPELFDALSASAQADCMEQVEVLAARLRARFLRRTPAEPAQVPDRLVPVPEAAPRLGLKPAALYELIRRGAFPSVRVGLKYVRVRLSDVERFVRTGAVEPRAYGAYSQPHGRSHAAPPPKAGQADPARARGAPQRQGEHRGPVGAKRNAHQAADGPAHPSSPGPADRKS